MSWVDGELLGFDLETTSVDPYTALPVSWSLVGFMGDEVTEVFSGLINPGVPIDPEAIEVHGITDEMVRRDGIGLQLALASIVDVIWRANQRGVPLVGQNVVYDLTLLDSCWRREFGGPMISIRPVIDLLVLDKEVETFRKGKRNLTTLAPHYGVERGERHEATSDVIAAVRTVRALVARYPGIGNIAAADLHERQVRWAREQQRSFSRYRVKNGEPEIPVWEWAWPVRDQPPQGQAVVA